MCSKWCFHHSSLASSSSSSLSSSSLSCSSLLGRCQQGQSWRCYVIRFDGVVRWACLELWKDHSLLVEHVWWQEQANVHYSHPALKSKLCRKGFNDCSFILRWTMSLMVVCIFSAFGWLVFRLRYPIDQVKAFKWKHQVKAFKWKWWCGPFIPFPSPPPTPPATHQDLDDPWCEVWRKIQSIRINWLDWADQVLDSSTHSLTHSWLAEWSHSGLMKSSGHPSDVHGAKNLSC